MTLCKKGQEFRPQLIGEQQIFVIRLKNPKDTGKFGTRIDSPGQRKQEFLAYRPCF